MSFDFRGGLLPAGSDAVNLPQIAALPYPITIDHSSTDIDEALAGNYKFWVQGRGDIRKVPNSIVALCYAATWEFNVSIGGDGGSATFSGELKRGISAEDGVETGTQIVTQRDAFSRGIYPPETLPEYKDSEMSFESNDTESEIQTTLLIRFNPTVLTYVAADDTWIVDSSFLAGTFTEGATTTVSSQGAGDDITGLEVCGDTWTLKGNNALSFSGTITPLTWLA
jgi:hypothetical protein